MNWLFLWWWGLWPKSWCQALTTAYKAMRARSHRRSWCDNAIVYLQQISRWRIVCCKLLQVRGGFRHAKRLLSSESPHWTTTTWKVAKWILNGAWCKKTQIPHGQMNSFASVRSSRFNLSSIQESQQRSIFDPIFLQFGINFSVISKNSVRWMQ